MKLIWQTIFKIIIKVKINYLKKCNWQLGNKIFCKRPQKQRLYKQKQVYSEVFEDYHGVISPSTTGVADKGLKNTGSPEFCTVWSFMGTPSISLPYLKVKIIYHWVFS